MDNPNADNSDLAKKYQEILEKYSKELASSKPIEDTPEETAPPVEPAEVTPEPVPVPEVEPEPEPPIEPTPQPVIQEQVPVEPEPTVEPTPVESEPTPVEPEPAPAPTPEPVVMQEETKHSPFVNPPPVSPTPIFEAVETPPPQNNFFKYLFFLSLLIFISVVGVIIYITFINPPKPPVPGGSTPDINVVPTVSEKVCDANDKKFKQGETFPAADGCNTCTCTSYLTITCTTKSCEPAPTTKVTPTIKSTPAVKK
jgi:hypothetical protein